MLDTMGAALASIGTGSIDFITYARRKIVPNFAASYRDLIRRVALMALARLQEEAAFAHSTIIGTVFTTILFVLAKKKADPRPHLANPTTLRPGPRNKDRPAQSIPWRSVWQALPAGLCAGGKGRQTADCEDKRRWAS
jgi:hypothetical protein